MVKEKILGYRLDIAVFITGAVIMIFELTGSRLLAPYFGGSIFVWTALIGVIMASLSLGYSLGGKLADKNHSKEQLADIILIAAILILLVAGVKDYLLTLVGNIFNFEAGSIIAAALLFAPASIALGMVSPYATKLKLEESKKTGATIGNIYAISTAGSIAGTFLTGFVLLPLLGSTKIIFFLVIFLVFASVITHLKLNKALLIIIIILFAFFVLFQSKSKYLLDTDTKYGRTWLSKETDKRSGKEIITLSQDVRGIQSAIFTESDELVFEYTKYYRLAGFFNPNIKRALMIGGAGYSYPKDFLAKNKDAEMTVVEIDSKITQLARDYFRLKDDSRLQIVHKDGRAFLNQSKERYDAILVDAFGANSAPPFQLTTKEAVEKEAKMLNENGVVVVNLISSLEGEFFRSEYATYKEYFKNVYVFGVDSQDKSMKQNIVLVATQKEMPTTNEEYREYLSHLVGGDIKKGKVLTDDFAPVDFLVEFQG